MISNIRSITKAGSGGTASLVIPIPAGTVVPVGDTLFLRLCSDVALQTGISDSHAENVWSTDISGGGAGTIFYALARLYVAAALDGDNGDTITVSYAASNKIAAALFAAAGVKNAAPNASDKLASATSTTPASNSITPTVDGCLIIGSVYNRQGDGNTYTHPAAPWLPLQDKSSDAGVSNNYRSVHGDYQIQAAKAAIQHTGASLSASATWQDVIAAYEPAAVADDYIPAITFG